MARYLHTDDPETVRLVYHCLSTILYRSVQQCSTLVYISVITSTAVIYNSVDLCRGTRTTRIKWYRFCSVGNDGRSFISIIYVCLLEKLIFYLEINLYLKIDVKV